MPKLQTPTVTPYDFSALPIMKDFIRLDEIEINGTPNLTLVISDQVEFIKLIDYTSNFPPVMEEYWVMFNEKDAQPTLEPPIQSPVSVNPFKRILNVFLGALL